MRAALAFVLLGAVWTGEAKASSFLVLEPSVSGPSIVTLGEPASFADVTTLPPSGPKEEPDLAIGEVDSPLQKPDPADSDIITLSPSIIAMGEPDVTQEKVAAIGGGSSKARPDPLPTVIRGGVVGDAFSPAAIGEPVTVTVEPSDQQASEAPPAAPPPATTKPE